MKIDISLDSGEDERILEGLRALLGVKQSAFAIVEEARPGQFQEKDFAIPQIQGLIERLTDDFYGPPEEPDAPPTASGWSGLG